MQALNLQFCKKMWQLTRLYWQSKEKWRSSALLAVIVGLNLGHVYLLVRFNAWHNTFYNALQNYDKTGFFSALGEFSILAAIYIIVAVYEFYLQQMLEIKWRKWLTEHYLDIWLNDRTYYRLKMFDTGTDNPDQRISEDVRLFVNITLRLSLGFLKAAVTLGSFVAILWRLSGSLTVPLGSVALNIPGYMVWVAVGYAAAGTWLTHKIGRPLVKLNFDQQRYEADFRFSLVRLRENCESIAFYGGENQEKEGFAQRFSKVFNNFWQLMRKQKQLTWFTSGYGQIAIIFPILVAAPRYFSNQIQLGGLMQISSAFNRVQDALSFIIDSYSLIAEWQAVINRLTGFTGDMDKTRQLACAAKVSIDTAGKREFEVDNLQVALPNGVVLVKDLSFKLLPGDWMLINGPSGSGKSTLMRTIAGLWPFGQGMVKIPQGQKTLFLPQKSYLPLGTLREVFMYPKGYVSFDDEQLKKVMRLCRLEDRIDQLDRVEDWSHILSLGEQQRIAFARAILQQPDWLFLDEATSAIDEPTERQLYKVLEEQLVNTAVISVGHRSSLGSYHRIKLSIDGRGNWQILK